MRSRGVPLALALMFGPELLKVLLSLFLLLCFLFLLCSSFAISIFSCASMAYRTPLSPWWNVADDLTESKNTTLLRHQHRRSYREHSAMDTVVCLTLAKRITPRLDEDHYHPRNLRSGGAAIAPPLTRRPGRRGMFLRQSIVFDRP